MSHNLAIKAVATSADRFYYREEHEWRNAGEPFFDWMLDKMEESRKQLAHYSANKDSDQITLTMSAVIDGVAEPDMVVPGLSYGEVAAFEIQWAEWQKEIAQVAKDEAHEKNKKRNWK